MKPKIFTLLLFLIMASSLLLGCGSKINQKQVQKKTINYRERLDSIKSTHKDEGYVLFEKFDQKDSYIIYATTTGVYKETVWGETITLIDDAEYLSYEEKCARVKKWHDPRNDKMLPTPVLEWEDFVMQGDPGDVIYYISGDLICKIKSGNLGYGDYKIICNEAGILIGSCLFLYDTPKVFYVDSNIKANDSDSYRFKGAVSIYIPDIPGIPSDISSFLQIKSIPFKYKEISWPFYISSEGVIEENLQEFLYQDKTCSVFLKDMFLEKVLKAIENERQNRIKKILDSAIELDDFTTAYKNNPIRAEQLYPRGSRIPLMVDIESIRRSDNPNYKYVLYSYLGFSAYTYIYTNDDSFAEKNYPKGCCMEATFAGYDDDKTFYFVDAFPHTFGPTSYQNDYNY